MWLLLGRGLRRGVKGPLRLLWRSVNPDEPVRPVAPDAPVARLCSSSETEPPADVDPWLASSSRGGAFLASFRSIFSPWKEELFFDRYGSSEVLWKDELRGCCTSSLPSLLLLLWLSLLAVPSSFRP